MRTARRRLRSAAGAAPGRTIPQRDEATGTDAVETPYARLRLPHERDEDPASTRGERQPVIERARRDLAAGLTDTDCYSHARLNFGRRHGKRRG